MPNRSTETARGRLTTILASEILSSDQEETFAIASENQLCQRFGVSRVTVRLALSDLENRGLIFKKHGKGTFAHGRNSRRVQPIGLLLKGDTWAEERRIMQFVNGVQSTLTAQRSSMMILNDSPANWNQELASRLGGVLVFPYNVIPEEVAWLSEHKIPYLLVGETDLPGPQIGFHQAEAAESLIRTILERGHRQICLLHENHPMFDQIKLKAMQAEALRAGLSPEQVVQINAGDFNGNLLSAARAAFALEPRPTAIITLNDSLAGPVYCVAQELRISIPQEVSLASFHEWSFLLSFTPRLHTVYFSLGKAGEWAAAALLQVGSTGDPLQGLVFPSDERPGESIGPAP